MKTMREYWDEFHALPEAEQQRLRELQDSLPARSGKTMGRLLDERRAEAKEDSEPKEV